MRMRYTRSILAVLLPLTTTALAIQPQNPLLAPINNMPSNSPPTSASANTNHNIFLSDVLTTERSINIFAGFTRDFAPLSQRFEDGNVNTTILAPLNSAIMGLPRKPWEDRDLEGGGVRAGAGDETERAKENMKRFVEAHVVPVSPWAEGEEGKVEALSGGQVWWVEKEGKRFVSLLQDYWERVRATDFVT